VLISDGIRIDDDERSFFEKINLKNTSLGFSLHALIVGKS